MDPSLPVGGGIETVLVPIILIAMPGPILRYWLGVECAAECATTLVLLAIATLLNALSAVPTVTSLEVRHGFHLP